MIRKILIFFGYKIEYVCECGTYTYRYDGIDQTMCRPIHNDMTVARRGQTRGLMVMF